MEKFDKKSIFIVCALFIAIFAIWSVFSALRNQGERIDGIRNDISVVREKQQSAIDRLGRIESGLDDSARKVDEISRGLGDVAGAINRTQDRVDASTSGAIDSAEAIKRGQSILGDIRARDAGED